MKRLMTKLAVAIAAVAPVAMAQEAAAPAAAKEEAKCPVSFGATMDFYSAYVWRGIILNDRPVWQPGASASYDAGDYGTFSASVWANFNADNRIGHTAAAGLDELDYTLGYTKDVGPVTLEAGHIWYTFPRWNGGCDGDSQYGRSTEEFYLGAAYNNDIVTPYVRSYADYNIVKGFYNQIGLRKSVSLTDQLTLNGDASVGLADKNYLDQYGDEIDPGFWDANLSVGLTYAVTDNISVGAKLAWMSLVNDDARDEINDLPGATIDKAGTDGNFGKPDTLWGGINLAVSF